MSDFIDFARADAAPNFSLRSLSANEDDRFIIQYIYSEEGNGGAAGLDIASGANCRAAALDTAGDGEVNLTAPITLVQAGGKICRGVLILLSTYRPGFALLNRPGNFGGHWL